MKKLRKKERWLRALISVLCIGVIIGAMLLSVSCYVKGSVKDRIVNVDELTGGGEDFVLVLGCGLRPDGTPSVMLSERLSTAVEIAERLPEAKLILSGDNNRKGYNEPEAMKKFCRQLGVSEDRMIIDENGFSTFESVENAYLDHLIGKKNSRLIIVTQEYHLSRALYIAKSFSQNAVGVAAYLRFYPKQILWSARELLARNKDFIKCAIS